MGKLCLGIVTLMGLPNPEPLRSRVVPEVWCVLFFLYFVRLTLCGPASPFRNEACANASHLQRKCRVHVNRCALVPVVPQVPVSFQSDGSLMDLGLGWRWVWVGWEGGGFDFGKLHH